ncbi:type IV pilin [Halorarius halobius]|uniref:type IV pilin n=1 Tax=Halorarius halobius TaxID=2962671 RepID=UPI0020CFDAB8|nr:type IV pilin [Halorarius halobius]
MGLSLGPRWPYSLYRSQNQAPDRAQSEVVGVVLLVALIVSVVAVFAVPAILDVDTDPAPFVGAEVSATTEHVTVVHGGGDAVPSRDIVVVLRYGDTADRVRLDGAHAGPFVPGDAVTLPLDPPVPFGSLVRVQVVHAPTGTSYVSDAVVAQGA